jgi:hypothetical protein
VAEGNLANSKLFKLRCLGSIKNENRGWIEVKERQMHCSLYTT